ncbi:MAG: U32 family peptidase [Puniceicoccales bacterium]|jgi:putative protease|nr:U32 family peptidase [Puniceicoccales bacterium]
MQPSGIAKPLILAPAGNWECARAAVENGADAIYFGIGQFNARARAGDFAEGELPALMTFLHKRGVRGYATFNTLVFTGELPAAERSLRAIITAGVDAAIVQDVGICRLIRQLSPDFPIHASTQMTITSAAGVLFARELGASVVVLARECPVSEIAAIRAELVTSGPTPALESFVHGALCVAYSGQCLTSEALGGRSANRGECAQACRLPYELVCDGKDMPLGGRRYLLSPRDLAGMEMLPELIQAGVSSLKIEGRLKSPEYVAAVTRAYKHAVDKICDATARGGETPSEVARNVRLESDYELEMSFSRGLGTGWLRGVNNHALVHARFGKKRGVFLGEVDAIQEGRVQLRLMAPLKPGDGVVFDDDRPEEREEGGFVHNVETRHDGTSWVYLAREALNWRRVRRGQKLWKTADPALSKRLRNSFVGNTPHFRRPIHIHAYGTCGSPLRVVFDDGQGHIAECLSSMPLSKAENQPLSETLLREQLGRLGNTAYAPGSIQTTLNGALILPIAELNHMRRILVSRLDALRSAPRHWVMERAPIAPPCAGRRQAHTTPLPPPELIPVIRHLSQLEPALLWGASTIYCEFENLRDYAPAVAHAKQSPLASPVEIWVIPPRIFKQGEEPILRQIAECGADGWLVRNHEQLRWTGKLRRRGDFSLNVTNPLSAEYFREHCGLERLTASYDLDTTQLAALLHATPPEWFELTIHQHMPMFHMEHCIFCAFLSNGKNFRDCGRPCEQHTVRLRDKTGIEHLVRADASCRNTVFNGRAQTGAEFAAELLALGLRHFRIELADEDAAATTRLLKYYAALLCGEISGSSLWRELRLRNQMGVTRGTLKPHTAAAC